MSVDLSAAFAILRDASFVSLTTFRKNGAAVSTPVWIAGDGPDLVVITPSETGKVKRIRSNPAVELVPCGRTGKVPDGMHPVAGTAEIVTDDVEATRLGGIIAAKYGVEFTITMLIERIVARRQKPRVLIRISPAG